MKLNSTCPERQTQGERRTEVLLTIIYCFTFNIKIIMAEKVALRSSSKRIYYLVNLEQFLLAT